MIITAGRPGEQTLLVRAVDGILGTHSVTYDQEWTLTLTAAQVHATLALAAATAVGRVGPDGHAWADVAATRLSASKPEPPGESSLGPDPELRRPPPLFPPEDRPRH